MHSQQEAVSFFATSILGGETVIGKGSVIGGNAFITESVPAGTRVSVKNPELSFSTKKKHSADELPR